LVEFTLPDASVSKFELQTLAVQVNPSKRKGSSFLGVAIVDVVIRVSGLFSD
jgi:hypothetical protein